MKDKPDQTYRIIDVNVANEVGVPAALIFQTIRIGIAYAKKTNQNFVEGEHWYYHSVRNLRKIHPYISRNNIARSPDKLEQAGLIEKGNYNKIKWDRTVWYRLKQKKPHVSESDTSICQNLAHPCVRTCTTIHINKELNKEVKYLAVKKPQEQKTRNDIEIKKKH